MALKVFHAIVTQFDCDEESAKRHGSERRGPLLFECYLDESVTEDQVREHAKTFARYGWVRVAEVTVNIPDGEDHVSST